MERLGLSPSGGDRKHRKRPQREQKKKTLQDLNSMLAKKKEKKNDNRWRLKRRVFWGVEVGGLEKGLWDGRG